MQLSNQYWGVRYQVAAGCVVSVIFYYGYIFTTECQTEDNRCTVPCARVYVCVHSYSQDQSVKTMLEGNNKLTRYYTGLPTYDSSVAFVQYLPPKAAALTPWNGSNTRDIPQSSLPINQPFAGLTIPDQLFSVLIRLRRGLEAFDVFQISLSCCFPFLQEIRFYSGCLHHLNVIIPKHGLSLIVVKSSVSVHQD